MQICCVSNDNEEFTSTTLSVHSGYFESQTSRTFSNTDVVQNEKNDIYLNQTIKKTYSNQPSLTHINKQDLDGRTLLMQTCQNGTLEEVKQLFGQGALVVVKDFKGNNALHYAVRNKTKECVQIIEYLIQQGLSQVKKQSPLFLSIDQNNLDIFELLLHQGASFTNKGADLILLRKIRHKKNFKKSLSFYLQESQIYKKSIFSEKQRKQLEELIKEQNSQVYEFSYQNKQQKLRKDDRVRRKTENDMETTAEQLEYKYKLTKSIQEIEQKIKLLKQQNQKLKQQSKQKFGVAKNCQYDQKELNCESQQQTVQELYQKIGSEIVQYYKCQKLELKEKKKFFNETFKFFQKTIQSKFNAKLSIRKSGSYQTNLMHCQSNLNMTIYLKNYLANQKLRANYQKGIKQFYEYLQTLDQIEFYNIQERKGLIIIKVLFFINAETKVEVEMVFKFDQNNYLPSNEQIIIDSIMQFPQIKYLFPVIKRILQKQDIDKPQNKGINSVGIILMLKAYFQQNEFNLQYQKQNSVSNSLSTCDTQISTGSSQQHLKVPDIGQQFVSFIYYFAYYFDQKNYEISFHQNQYYLNCINQKQKEHIKSPFVICHPNNPDIILTKSFKRYSEMQGLFQLAYANLFNKCGCSKNKVIKIEYQEPIFENHGCNQVYYQQKKTCNDLDCPQFLNCKLKNSIQRNRLCKQNIFLPFLFNFNLHKFSFQCKQFLLFYQQFKQKMNDFQNNYEKIEENGHIIFQPCDNSVENSIIWLHGLGSGPQEFEEFFSYYQLVPQTFRIILLQAPIAEVTLNYGRLSSSWFDIESLDFDTNNINHEDYLENIKILQQYINKEKKILKSTQKIFLGGFSQGACMTLNYVLSNDQKFGGTIACSGFLFDLTAIKNLQTPIFASHGTRDDIIPFQYVSNQFKNKLKTHRNFQFYEMKNLGHQICPQTIKHIKNFIRKFTKQINSVHQTRQNFVCFFCFVDMRRNHFKLSVLSF